MWHMPIIRGGSRSHPAQEEVDPILFWAEIHVPALSMVHIPGVENWQADFLFLPSAVGSREWFQGTLSTMGHAGCGSARFNKK